MTRRKCLGFAKTLGKCQEWNHKGVSDYWCEKCNKARLEHLNQQFNTLAKAFELTND